MTTQEQDVPSIPDIDLSHAVRSDACVLFTGDQRQPRSSHAASMGSAAGGKGPFVAVDCGQPEASLESHLVQPA